MLLCELDELEVLTELLDVLTELLELDELLVLIELLELLLEFDDEDDDCELLLLSSSIWSTANSELAGSLAGGPRCIKEPV